MVIWMVGLSGAGKTTIGRRVFEQWKRRESNVVLLDGDELRGVIGLEPGTDPHSIEGRRRNAERMTAMCELLDRQGIHVVCCILSVFPQMRRQNRDRFSQYFEVHVATPLDVCVRRDLKNIYAPALRGETKNVVGLDIPYEPPSGADLVLENGRDGMRSDVLADQVIAATWAVREGSEIAATIEDAAVASTQSL